MKGFEIDINGKIIYAALDMGVISLIIENDGISITGRDTGAGVAIVWGRIPLDMGDKIVIRSVNNAVCGTPETVENIDRQKLLSEYHALKKILTEKEFLK